MKRVVIMLAAALAATSNASAQGVDIETFGQSLNGWRKDRTAVYTIDNQTYRTHVPTVSRNPSGGAFISARVDHISAVRADAVCHIELTVTPDGHVGAAQIRVMANKKQYNTGQVLRQFTQPSETDPAQWQTSYTRMVLDLFGKLDTEFAKTDEKDKEGKRDLWGRFNQSQLDEANLAAALRHNLNMLVENIGFSYPAYGMK